MGDWQGDVQDFHVKHGLPVATKPGIPNEEQVSMRLNLLFEEHEELEQAVLREDLPAIADGAADLIYVVLGLCLTYGIDLRPIWGEVHRTNMLKDGGKRRQDGKILKPKDWKPPDIEELLAHQGWLP